jgi:phage protein D
MATPDFRIIAEGADITAAIRRGLLSLSVTDEAGFTSDKTEIKLDDRDGKIELPRTGAKLEISLGYKETGLVNMGIYVVDEVVVESPPQSMTIHAHAADMRQVLKAPRTKTWGKITIGDLVNAIAAEHSLTPRITQELAAFEIPHLIQTEESDLHLLTRLALAHDAITKPVNGFLLFAPKGEAKAVSGTLISPVTLSAKDITSWQVTFAERGKYSAVEGVWHNKQTALQEKVKIGDGTPVYTIRHTYDTKEQLEAAAKAKLNQLQRGTGTLTVSLPGNPRFMAEGKLTLVNIRSGADGDWNITTVEHQLDNSGYICRINAQTSNK